MNNDSVKGYVILALKNLGYDLENIEMILDELHYQFDEKTVKEAEDYYNSRVWQME